MFSMIRESNPTAASSRASCAAVETISSSESEACGDPGSARTWTIPIRAMGVRPKTEVCSDMGAMIPAAALAPRSAADQRPIHAVFVQPRQLSPHRLDVLLGRAGVEEHDRLLGPDVPLAQRPLQHPQ